MKVSIITAAMFLVIGSAAFAAKCTEAEKAKGGVSKNMSAESDGYFKNKDLWVCVMPSEGKKGEYLGVSVTPKHEEEEEGPAED